MNTRNIVKVISLGLAIFYGLWITIKMINKDAVYKKEVIAYSVYLTTFIAMQFNLL